MKEYRVIWKREGLSQRSRRFVQKKFANRWLMLLTVPEPWDLFDLDGDDYVCCSGHECGCGGQTVRQSFNKRREGLPKLINYGIQEREVGKWE